MKSQVRRPFTVDKPSFSLGKCLYHSMQLVHVRLLAWSSIYLSFDYNFRYTRKKNWLDSLTSVLYSFRRCERRSEGVGGGIEGGGGGGKQHLPPVLLLSSLDASTSPSCGQCDAISVLSRCSNVHWRFNCPCLRCSDINNVYQSVTSSPRPTGCEWETKISLNRQASVWIHESSGQYLIQFDGTTAKKRKYDAIGG